MGRIKAAVIGAGSTYTPELIEGFIKRTGTLPISEIALMDIDEYRLSVVGGFAGKMIGAAGLGWRVTLTTSLDEALYGADYVLAQVRVGRLQARVLDETIPLKYGLIGQETVGIGGFFKALRTVPVIMDVAERMGRLCPDAWLINFSNPSGIVAEAVLNNTGMKMMGLCNVPTNMISDVHRWPGCENAQVEYLGLNHLSWITSVRAGGRDILRETLELGRDCGIDDCIVSDDMDMECLKAAGAVPSSYLGYFYSREQSLRQIEAAGRSRGEVCEEIEKELYDIYLNTNVYTKPELLNQRGGALYSEAAVSLVDSIENDRGDVQIVNVRNRGALDFMEPDDVVEVAAEIGRNGPKPVEIRGFNNRHIIELMRVVKAYERYAARAAITGDRTEAMRALMIHPLVGDFPKARQCFDEMLEAHKQYLPQFFR